MLSPECTLTQEIQLWFTRHFFLVRRWDLGTKIDSWQKGTVFALFNICNIVMLTAKKIPLPTNEECIYYLTLTTYYQLAQSTLKIVLH